jgi:RNA polymerase sigma-70 factor (ECF subfamily)
MERVDPSDEELIKQISQAQPEAVRVLYRRYGRMVYSVALRAVGDPSAAEEITQDVFLRIWEKAETYRADKAKVVTWIARIARNRAIDVYRQRKSRDDRASAGWEELKQAAATAQEQHPGDRMDMARLQGRVREAVASLPPDQKTALALAFFQGRTHKEIADELGEPLGTVKTRIRAAMQKLRSILDGVGEL